MKKRLLIILTCIISVAACVFGLTGCTKDKTFEKAGMQITLTSAFYEKEIVSMTAYYESTEAIVTALKEDFSAAPGFSGYTLNDYAQAVLANNGLNASVKNREGKDYLYFTYEKSVSGKDFYYLATTHKANDAFWLIQFACVTANKDKFTETFLGWADTVTFKSTTI